MMAKEPQPIGGHTAPRLESKYFKPQSLTWWASVVPLLIGIVVASEPLHGWSDLTQTLRNLAGDVPPAMLINAGLAGIGIRGAIT